MRDSSLPSPDHSCNIARPVSLPCDSLMTQICTMSSPLSGSSGAYCSEPLILLSATRTPTQAQTSCFFRIFFTFFQIFSCLRVFYHIFDGFCRRFSCKIILTKKKLLSVFRRTASFLLIFLAKNQVINARNVIGANNARRRSILIRTLNLSGSSDTITLACFQSSLFRNCA